MTGENVGTASGKLPSGSKSSKGTAVRVGFYDVERTIGKGNFAVVKLGRHRVTKTEVSRIWCKELIFIISRRDWEKSIFAKSGASSLKFAFSVPSQTLSFRA